MTNFELLLIFFIPVRKGLFCKASDINLHSELFIRSKPFFKMSCYGHILSLFNSK